MDVKRRYYTIPKLAERLGVTAASLRDWIKHGYIEEPPRLPVASHLHGSPVWLIIVAPPSSGKSDVITAVSSVIGVYAVSKITENTLASGLVDGTQSGQPPSLLLRLRAQGKRLIAVKDLGTILSLPPLQRNPILAQLREVFDGKMNATYGTGVEVDWEGQLGFLAGATPAVDRQQKLQQELGERFFYYRPLTPDPQKVAMKALLRQSDERARRKALAAAYRSGFEASLEVRRRLIAEKRDCLEAEAYPVIAALGELVASARRAVRRERGWYDDRFEVLPA